MDTLKVMAEEVATKQKNEIDERFTNEFNREKEELQRNLEVSISQLEKAQEKREVELEQTRKQQIQRLQLEEKQAILKEKQTKLEELFTSANEELEKLSETEFQALLTTAMDKLQALENAEVILGEKSIGKVSEDFLKKYNEEKKTTFFLSREIQKNDGGFLIRKDGIEYNFLFTSLLREVKEKEISLISKELFKER